MARSTLVFTLLIALVLAGCASCSAALPTASEQRFPAQDLQTISIELKAGDLSLFPAAGQEVVISASMSDPAALAAAQTNSLLTLALPASQAGDALTVQVPAGIDLTIQTFSADIHISGLGGNLEVRSTAGDITLEDFSGQALVWAGRGAVSLQGGAGAAAIIGEHGALSVSEFAGDVSMTTIMGSITYHAPQNAQGIVSLEADHGSIQAALPDSADLAIQASTTSGNVICLGAALSDTVDGCQGALGNGTGQLTIRTVSGKIQLQITHPAQERP